MQDKQKKPEQQSPADIAREAFRRLAVRRIAPTPDAYREIYEEIAGIPGQPGAEQVLADFAASLASVSDDVARIAEQLSRALQTRNWEKFGKDLDQLVEKHLRQAAAGIRQSARAEHDKDARAARNAIPLVDPVAPLPARGTSIPLVDDPAPARATSAAIPLVDALEPPPAKATPAVATAESPQARMLRDLLTRTLTLAVSSLLSQAPELAQEAEALAVSIRDAVTEKELNDISARLKQLCFKIEIKSGDMAEEHELLLRLFKLLLDNVSELLDDDSWLSGQIASVQQVLSGPLSHTALEDATRSLKEVIYKQSMLKHSLAEAKLSMKNMMITFIDRLSAVAATTGSYHEKISTYSHKISKAQGIPELNRILEDVMHETKVVQTEALRSRDEMEAARQDVQKAESRINELESQLDQLSELVREDQLTGSLNRRGLNDVLGRELARSERRKTPLCIALLDLDDFKKLNDTHGHSAGDGALVHLVKVVKDTLRSMDVVARFGGEEFMLVLPETPLEDAVQTVSRVQRELTKQIFMYENKKLLITFSAGVALRAAGEAPEEMFKRADEALYKAKKAGKNRVVAAE